MRPIRFACLVVADLARAVALALLFVLAYFAGAAATLSLLLRGWLKLRWIHAASNTQSSPQPSIPDAHGDEG